MSCSRIDDLTFSPIMQLCIDARAEQGGMIVVVLESMRNPASNEFNHLMFGEDGGER